MRYSYQKAKPCRLESICGGCSYSSLPYEIELEKKMGREIALFSRYAYVYPIIPSKRENYRDKVQAVIGKDRKGNVISGLYAKGSHHLVSVKSCQLEFEGASKILSTVRKFTKSLGIEPYDEDMKNGLIRHVLLRKGHESGEILVALVFGNDNVGKAKELANALKREHEEITTIVYQVNGEETSMVLSRMPFKTLYGKGYINDTLMGLSFTIHPASFYQINNAQTGMLYKVALKMAGLTGRERVIDAYSGTGTIALAASRMAREVVAVEINKDAVESGKESARENGIDNVEFVLDDASEYLKGLSKRKEEFDVVFLDPPRRGSDERFLSSLIKLKPRTIIYISCNPETLERDMRYILRFGPYEVLGVQPVDMFPCTDQIESVALFERKREEVS